MPNNFLLLAEVKEHPGAVRHRLSVHQPPFPLLIGRRDLHLKDLYAALRDDFGLFEGGGKAMARNPCKQAKTGHNRQNAVQAQGLD